MKRMMTVLAGIAACAALAAQAQVPQYGPNVTLEQARKAMAAAEAEARKNSYAMAIAIVDTAGSLVLYQKLDNTQSASPQIAVQKAVTAATFRRSTKVFQDQVAALGEGMRIFTFQGVSAAEGGIPLSIDGKIVGGIGASGGTGQQDGVVAQAGVNALK